MGITVTRAQLVVARALARAHHQAWGRESLLYADGKLILGAGSDAQEVALVGEEVPRDGLEAALVRRWGGAAPALGESGAIYHSTATGRLRWRISREVVEVDVNRPTPDRRVDVVLRLVAPTSGAGDARVEALGPYAERHLAALTRAASAILGFRRAAALIGPLAQGATKGKGDGDGGEQRPGQRGDRGGDQAEVVDGGLAGGEPGDLGAGRPAADR